MAKSPQVDEYLNKLATDWQRQNLETFRKLIHESVPMVEEGWKWSVPVFLVNGKLLCAMSDFKEHTKFNFFNGAKLTDSHKTFNSGLDSKQHRSLNLSEGEKVPTAELKDLLTEAAAMLNS